uniref:YrhA family protein n=1 Tax=Cronobacter sakazakii TaxID=28141 RepID=UPI000CFBE70D
MKRAELDIVVLGEDLPDEGLEKGTVGTIVMVFDTPTLGYLVEFCDKEGRTIAMPALLPAQIKRYFTPGILKTLLVDNNYPVANPVNPEVMADVMRKAPPAEWDTQKKKVYEDIQRLMINRPDYSDMFQIMDGLEYNGLTLYSMANIYIRNVETHNNESAIDSNLSDKVLIGRNEMFVFVYSFTDDRFET